METRSGARRKEMAVVDVGCLYLARVCESESFSRWNKCCNAKFLAAEIVDTSPIQDAGG